MAMAMAITGGCHVRQGLVLTVRCNQQTNSRSGDYSENPKKTGDFYGDFYGVIMNHCGNSYN
jgi:hypothetical protein